MKVKSQSQELYSPLLLKGNCIIIIGVLKRNDLVSINRLKMSSSIVHISLFFRSVSIQCTMGKEYKFMIFSDLITGALFGTDDLIIDSSVMNVY